jgi:hypothetical protein
VREATGRKGIDIIYDFVGGAITRECFSALAPLGELVFAALNRCQLTARDLETMFNQNQSIKGFALLPLLGRHYLTRRAFQAVRSCPSRGPESLNREPLSVGTGRRSSPSVGESVNNRQSGADPVGISPVGRKTLVGRGSRTTQRDRGAPRLPPAEQCCYAVKRAEPWVYRSAAARRV